MSGSPAIRAALLGGFLSGNGRFLRTRPFHCQHRTDGFVPDQATQVPPLIDEHRASFEGFSLSLERQLCWRQPSIICTYA